MRKLATSLLTACLLFSGRNLWSQQTPTQPTSSQPNASQTGQSPSSQTPKNPPPSQQEPETTLKVDVKLVNVFVTVTDDHGSPVGGLTKENFTLNEDGAEQKISVFDKESALPLSIALAIDSGRLVSV